MVPYSWTWWIIVFLHILGLRAANENMDKLMGRLETLSVAIGQLNPASSEKNSPAATGGSGSAAGISNVGAKNSHDSQKLDRWQPEKNIRENNAANQSIKSAKRKMLVRQKKSIATDDEISET